MSRTQAWTFILIAGLFVGLMHSWDSCWRMEREQRAQLARLWEAEAEITDLTTWVRAARDDVRKLKEQVAAIEQQADAEAQLPTETSWGTGSMGDAQIWDSHLVDLRNDESRRLHVFCWHGGQ